jgi:hypothetical protein
MNMAKTQTFDEQLQQLVDFYSNIMERGMQGMAGAVWPVIIRRWGNAYDGPAYEYQYPSTYFSNLKQQYRLFVYAGTKAERIKALKLIVDKLMAGEIDIHLYHFGIYLLYPYLNSYRQDEDENAVGKKRYEYITKLPWFELKNNDEFLTSVWSDLIERRYPEVGEEIVRVPSLSEVRMLFTPELFSNHTGVHYYDADWVEPISGRLRIEVKKWVGEKDPMTPQPKKEGMIEGPIVLGHEGGANGLRHFVAGEPIHAGSYMEVKFGDGWIPGRYEWNFEQGNPIQICSSREQSILIREGHLVRIRK